jgi:hypothetical protein
MTRLDACLAASIEEGPLPAQAGAFTLRDPGPQDEEKGSARSARNDGFCWVATFESKR